MDSKVDDEVIYHFTTLSTALEKILYNGTLRLGQLMGTNDPNEFKDWIPTIALTGDLRYLQPKEIEELFNGAKKRAQLICFSEDRDPPKRPESGLDFHMAPFKSKYYLGYYRPRMWAQYAENHKGLCLGFNKKKLLNKIKQHCSETGEIIAKSVEYGNDYVQNNALTLDLGEIQSDYDKFIKEHQRKYLKELFFNKSIDWRDETEFRILYLPFDFKEQRDSTFIDIHDCIETIIVGINFPKVYIPSLINLKKGYPNTTLKSLKYYNDKIYLDSF